MHGKREQEMVLELELEPELEPLSLVDGYAFGSCLNFSHRAGAHRTLRK